MEAQGLVKDITEEIEGQVVRVHILDPFGGVDLTKAAEDPDILNKLLTASEQGHYRTEQWTIGKDILPEKAEKFKDGSTGDLYAIVSFEDGNKRVHVMAKSFWDQAKAQMDTVC